MYVAVRGSLDPVPADGITLGEVLLKGVIELRDRRYDGIRSLLAAST